MCYLNILPKFELVKNINGINILDGSFLLRSKSLIRNYNTNVYEKNNVNDFIFNSNPKINRYGFFNNHEFLVRNSNSENKNSNYKNKKSLFLSGIYQFNSSLPLINENGSYQKILKPKFSIKVAPNHTKNERNVERKIVRVSEVEEINPIIIKYLNRLSDLFYLMALYENRNQSKKESPVNFDI